jgi:hypothetical protein
VFYKKRLGLSAMKIDNTVREIAGEGKIWAALHGKAESHLALLVTKCQMDVSDYWLKFERSQRRRP